MKIKLTSLKENDIVNIIAFNSKYKYRVRVLKVEKNILYPKKWRSLYSDGRKGVLGTGGIFTEVIVLNKVKRL